MPCEFCIPFLFTVLVGDNTNKGEKGIITFNTRPGAFDNLTAIDPKTMEEKPGNMNEIVGIYIVHKGLEIPFKKKRN